MKTQFKLVVLMLMTSVIIYAQEQPKIEMDEIHTIYKESFSTDANTTLVLNFRDTSVKIKESMDNMVHINYTMEFKNFSKKSIKSALNRLRISGKKEGNKITYTTKGKHPYHSSSFLFDNMLVGRLGNKDSISTKVKVVQKSLDSVMSEIKYSDKLLRDKIFGTLKVKPRVKKWKRSEKIHISKMIIEIPKNVNIRITSENSGLNFEDNFDNRLILNSRNSRLKFKTITNSLNILDVDNGRFWVQTIRGGNYSFANSRSVIIGQISNAKVNSEFTKVQLGEIGENVKLVDFNSEYFLYNWADNFKQFRLDSEYSKVHLFSPNSEYKFIAFGNNTKHITNTVVGDLQPTKKKEKYKMVEHLPKGSLDISGEIYFDMVNGIIYLY